MPISPPANIEPWLADLLIAKGPEAPALCEGWATRDLAAYLWIRENRPDAAAGMFVAAAQVHLDTVTSQMLARPYDELVEAWAEGPARFSPVRIVDRWMNLAEHFVHHEDGAHVTIAAQGAPDLRRGL